MRVNDAKTEEAFGEESSSLSTVRPSVRFLPSSLPRPGARGREKFTISLLEVAGGN